MNQFWEVASEEEKLIYAPLYFFWNICVVIPTRPRAFTYLQYDCIEKDEEGIYYIYLPQSICKGSSQSASKKLPRNTTYDDYPKIRRSISEKIACELMWYREKVKDTIDMSDCNDIAQMVGYESINSNNIDDVLEEFKRKYAGKNLFYLEFDTVNQGRISIYKMYSYSINESKKIIENMAYFYKRMTEFYFWEEKEVYSNWNLKKILNLHFSIHSSRDFARIGQRIDLFYSETISLLFAGEIQKLCGKYLFSHIRELGMTNFGLAQRLFNLQIQMKVEEEMKKEEEMKIDVSLVAGELMGYVFQLEEQCRIKDGAKKGKFFLCERYLDQFQKQPEKTWLMIRKDIQKIFARYPTDFCWLQKRIENREALLYGVCEWEKKGNLSGAVYVGFNLAKRNLEYLEEERGLRRCIIIDFC